MSNFGIKVNLTGLNTMLANTAAAVAQATRPAAQAGAQVLYDAVKSNVRRIGRKTGNLEKSIYQAYSPENSRPGLAVYNVSWNARKAPHGQLVERGHIQRFKVVLSKKTGKWITLKNQPLKTPKQIAAQPFMRPAMAFFPKAQAAAKAAFNKHFQEHK